MRSRTAVAVTAAKRRRASRIARSLSAQTRNRLQKLAGSALVRPNEIP